MDVREQTEVVLRLTGEAGFARVGIARAGPVSRADYLDSWLARGWVGQMHYLAKNRELRGDPRQLLPGARSVIVVADLYHQPEPAAPGRDDGSSGPERDLTATGRIARYAWGRDYHRVLRKKLHRLVDRIRQSIDGEFETRACVDTAPVLEREWAAAAGVGWIGKNTMVLHESIGSFFFLGEIVTTLELVPSGPAADHCGTCTRCLQACPTGALVAPYQMDARRCISYLTIEHRDDVDPDLRPLVGDWLYGCDICQDVCPFNREAPGAVDPAYLSSERNPLPPQASLERVRAWTQEDYDRHLAGSAMRRASLPMLKRNADIVAANVKEPRASIRAADEADSSSPDRAG